LGMLFYFELDLTEVAKILKAVQVSLTWWIIVKRSGYTAWA